MGASVTLPCCLKSLNFFNSSPDFRTIFSSALPFVRLEELLITRCNELETLPDDIGDLVPSLRKLTIQECYYFSHLPESFTSLSHLEELIVSLSGHLILPDSFGYMPALKLLVLDAVDILELPPSFCHLTSLEALFINSLGPFREGASYVVDISQLSQLRVLKLNCVGVTCGPAVKRRLSCLEQPEQVEQLQQLEHLEMRWKGYRRELPVPLTFLPRLRSLLIEAPGIRSLPKIMAAVLPQLRQLELLSWSPEELPESILEISSLTSLKLHAPQLELLPQGMSRLSRLHKLELIRCNALQHLPEFLSQLQQLILRDTSIPSLPASFVELIVEGLEDD
ncbi:unnamed protein product [Closterium sp. Naga37s-1]|nr:unnamed protein product [Closterium sp. Naga37s-1]